MRSPRDRLTLCRHLIRQPAAATFSHWRRLSFVSALFANKYKPAFSNNYSFQSNAYSPKKVPCTTPRHPTAPPLRVILSGGRQPGVEPVRATAGRDLQPSSIPTFVERTDKGDHSRKSDKKAFPPREKLFYISASERPTGKRRKNPKNCG